MSNYLGLDYGSRRIGLALANAQARLAAPWAVWDNSNDFMERLAQLVITEAIDVIVIGLPRNLEGMETPQSLTTRQFAKTVAKLLGVKVVLQDESLTSVLAQEQFKNSSKAARDSQAAALILQDYVDSL